LNGGKPERVGRGGDHWWGKNAMIKKLGKIFLRIRKFKSGRGMEEEELSNIRGNARIF
jgi:hypothetical protein